MQSVVRLFASLRLRPANDDNQSELGVKWNGVEPLSPNRGREGERDEARVYLDALKAQVVFARV